MPMKIVNVDPTGAELTIGDTGQVAAFGDEVEVDSALAERLIETGLWARPTTKAAKQAEKESGS